MSRGGILEKIEKLETKVAELSTARKIDHGTFYVVKRPVPLNIEKRFRRTSVVWLFPGQVVELVERSGKWIEVSVFDHETGSVRVGWVLKKYLHRIK